MKVVLFCGGQGMRMRDYSEAMPKPMVPLGSRPMLWHIMKYYAHHGHKDFILCLGYKAGAIKDYFLHYDECVSNDFVLSEGGRSVGPHHRDIEDWRITCVDIGVSASVGERLRAVERFVGDEEMFLANYSDGLSDFPLPTLIDDFRHRRDVAGFLAVRPNCSFHRVTWDSDGAVTALSTMVDAGLWINGGFFVFRRAIFDCIHAGEDLVGEPFHRLIRRRQLRAYPYEGFWRAVDTFADLRALEAYLAQGNAPWEVWRTRQRGAPVQRILRNETNAGALDRSGGAGQRRHVPRLSAS